MSLSIDQIAEAFCSYRFVVTYPYMTDEIKWNIVGREELMGREAVIDGCEAPAKFLRHCEMRCTISRSRESNLKCASRNVWQLSMGNLLR